jgi:hypothetical protein
MSPIDRLRLHCSKIIPVLALEAIQNPMTGDWFIQRGDGKRSRQFFKDKRDLNRFIARGETPSF